MSAFYILGGIGGLALICLGVQDGLRRRRANRFCFPRRGIRR